MPALCYALDENILSDADYELLKDADFSILGTATPTYTAAIVIIFVRNFYERGSGNNPWQCTPVINNKDCKDGFLYAVSQDPNCSKLGFKNPMFPVADANSVAIRPWLLSQCWVIKAENGGITSEILKNNAILYDSLLCSFGARKPWAGDSQFFDGWQVPDVLSVKRYIKWLFENHKWLLIQSLYAIDAEGKAPDDLPNWLKPLWGLKRNAIRENIKLENNVCKQCTKIDLIFVYNNSYYPALDLQKWGKDKIVKQGAKVYNPKTNLIPLRDLKNKGFDLKETFIVSDVDNEQEVVLSDFFENEFSFFSPKKRNRIWRGMEKFSLITQEKNSFSRRLLVVRNNNKETSLQYGDNECACSSTAKVNDFNLWCSVFELKPLPEVTSYVSVDEDPLFELTNPSSFELDVSSIKLENHEYRDYKVVVGKTATAFSLVPLQPCDCSSVDFKEEWNGGWVLEVHDDAFFKPIKVVFRNAEEVIERNLFFVPESFFEENKDDFDFSDGIEGKWKLQHENWLFKGDIETAEWCWNGDTRQQLIEGPEANHRTLCLYGSFENLKLEVDGCEVWAYCSGKTPSELLSYFEPELMPGRSYCLRINGKEAYKGAYQPQDSRFIERSNKIYVYVPDKQCTIRVQHELFYKSFYDLEASRKWKREYHESELKWDNNNCAEIPLGYTQFGVDGHVLISLDAKKEKRHIEKAYTGTRNLKDRWGEIDVCVILKDFDIPHDTKFYEDIMNAAKLVGNATSYDELLQIDLIQNAIHTPIPKPRRNGIRHVLMENGFFRPDYCKVKQCSHFSDYYGCRKTSEWGECLSIITAYAEGNTVPRVDAVCNFCANWAQHTDYSLQPNEQQRLLRLWQDIKRRVIPKNASWLCDLGDFLMTSNQYAPLMYLCAAVKLCFLDNPHVQNNQDFVLDRVSQHCETLRKFVLLVRCALTLS